MDIDVEAMLDAPYEAKREEHSRSPHRDHSDRDRRDRDYHDIDRREHDRREYRDYRDEEYHRSRHSDRYSPRSHSHHRSSRYDSPSRYSSRRYHHSSRSISRDRRHRRSPSREYRRSDSRRRSRSPPRYKRSRSPIRERRVRSPSPAIPEEERDRRTVFVTQLAARLTTRELEEFFTQAGKVRQAKIITDRHSKKSKGAGYVEFYEEQSVQNALALSGTKLLGIPVLVSLSEAEKNRLAMQAAGVGYGASNEALYQRLYVGSVHFSLTEDDVRQIFEPFGPLDFVNLHKDPETGRSKGYGFIQFRNAADAKQALDKMNGFELAGRNLKVGLVTQQMLSSGGFGGYNLDDGETEGVALNSLSRAELMAKLAARDSYMDEDEPEPKPSASQPKPFIPTSTSRYVMLNNMFDPAEETEPDWVSDLETDIKLECERYGSVEHIKVNADSMGEVFLKFDSSRSAEKAIKELNGRWFGGKKITASYVSEAIFNANAL